MQVSDDDASAAVAVELVDKDSDSVERIERNERWSFFRIYQPNKWRLRQQKMFA